MALVDPVVASPVRYASLAKARAAIAGLKRADLGRLERIARMRSAPFATLDWSDLLNDALVRVLAGQRRWPTHVDLAAFLAQVMRSIASEHWRGVRDQPLRMAAAETDIAAWEQVADDAPLADQVCAARETLDAIYEHFAGDAGVMAVLSGIERDETAAQTVSRLDIDPKVYDAARKRFGRGMERIAHEGRLA